MYIYIRAVTGRCACTKLSQPQPCRSISNHQTTHPHKPGIATTRDHPAPALRSGHLSRRPGQHRRPHEPRALVPVRVRVAFLGPAEFSACCPFWLPREEFAPVRKSSESFGIGMGSQMAVNCIHLTTKVPTTSCVRVHPARSSSP